MLNRPRLAIIGAGFSGSALAMQVLSGGRRAPNVHLIDRSGRFGPGLAYSTTSAAHLLNVRAFKMSAHAGEPDGFVEWLAPNPPSPNANFARRSTYGAYLECLVRRAARHAAPGALSLVRDAATACRPHSEGFQIAFASGAKLDVDAVVLALGNQACATPAPLDALVSERFIANPWDAGALARISPDDDVLLIGTGQTMIDAALTLTSAPRTGRIVALSRRGLVPRAHTNWTPDEPVTPLLEAAGPLSGLLHAVRAEIAAAEARGEPWQHVMDRLRMEALALWRSLPLEAQQRFLRHLRPWWDVHRHRAPPHIATWLAALAASGLVEIEAGKIVAAEARDDRVEVTHRPRGEANARTRSFSWVINCTGPDPDVRRSRDPLIAQMLADGIVRPHATGLGFDVSVDARLHDARGRTWNELFALGPLTQGAYWESTAVPELRERAAMLARRLIARAPRRAPKFEGALNQVR